MVASACLRPNCRRDVKATPPREQPCPSSLRSLPPSSPPGRHRARRNRSPRQAAEYLLLPFLLPAETTGMLLSLLLVLLAQDFASPPNVAASDLAAAIELAQSGRDAEALVALQTIAAANPEDHVARLWIANLHMRMGHPNLAEAVYRAIVVEDPRSVDAWVGLGTALLHQERIAEAIDTLVRGEEIAPENPNVVSALASAFQLAGDDRRSISYRQRLV